ncbi:MAG TPA: RNA-binding S4 domain-containing protein [Xanthomonadaceae bacterium]|nr:RNA-binding S4 domain-containing protein [Xanthomonadaceae bacterium]
MAAAIPAADVEPRPPAAGPPVRLDVWLWAARMFKNRSLARAAIEAGKVEVAGQRAKPARLLQVGDALKVSRGDEVRELKVLGLSPSRGPARVAQGLYLETEASRIQREALRLQRRDARAGYQAPLTKPDRRARKLIRALGDIDAL